jgi:hypothetical protein
LTLSYAYVFSAKHYFIVVEPRGFEPLTSAVQSQSTIIAGRSLLFENTTPKVGVPLLEQPVVHLEDGACLEALTRL